MKIGIFGAGCIGLYVGGRLMKAGSAEVLFIGRPRMAATLQRHGLSIASYAAPNERTHFAWEHLNWSEDPKALAQQNVDAVIVTVKCDATSTIGR